MTNPAISTEIEDPLAALEHATSPDRADLGSPFRWRGHAAATSSRALLVLVGQAKLTDREAPENIRLEAVDPLRELHAIEWPDGIVPAHNPPELCAECRGRGEEACSDCGGTGLCLRCETGPCDECDGKGRYRCSACGGTGKQDQRRPLGCAPTILVVAGREALIDLSLLASQLHHLPRPTHACIHPQGRHDALFVGGWGWRLVVMPLSTTYAPRSARPRIEIPLAAGGGAS